MILVFRYVCMNLFFPSLPALLSLCCCCSSLAKTTPHRTPITLTSLDTFFLPLLLRQLVIGTVWWDSYGECHGPSLPSSMLTSALEGMFASEARLPCPSLVSQLLAIHQYSTGHVPQEHQGWCFPPAQPEIKRQHSSFSATLWLAGRVGHTCQTHLPLLQQGLEFHVFISLT